MHSISLNKLISFSLVLAFLLISPIAVGQVELSPKKSDSKHFLEYLVRLYSPTLKIIRGKISVTTPIILAESTEKESHFGNGNYSLSFKIALENVNKIKFSNPSIDTLTFAYSGKSDHLHELFNEIYSHSPLNTKDSNNVKNSFLKDCLTVRLFNDGDFIKRYYNRMWRKYRRPDRITLGVFGGVNFSTAFVSPFRYSDDTELKTKTRRENEEYLPTSIFGLFAGYTHYSHGVDFFYQHTNYGCKYVEGNQINWITGFYTGSESDSSNMKLSIPINQFGIRYRYSNYFKTVSTYASVGMHLSYVNSSSRELLRLNSRYLSTGCNLALGLNIHPVYALNIHIAPVMNISFDSVKKTELQTRFSSLSLEVGLNYNFTFINEKYKNPAKASSKKRTSKPGKTGGTSTSGTPTSGTTGGATGIPTTSGGTTTPAGTPKP